MAVWSCTSGKPVLSSGIGTDSRHRGYVACRIGTNSRHHGNIARRTVGQIARQRIGTSTSGTTPKCIALAKWMHLTGSSQVRPTFRGVLDEFPCPAPRRCGTNQIHQKAGRATANTNGGPGSYGPSVLQWLVLSGSTLILESLKSGRLFGYLARRPGNRASTARCPRGRAGTPRVQVVDARGRRCQEWRRNDRAKAER
jgi:hypothetical protein